MIEKQATSLPEIFAQAKAIRDSWNPGRDAAEEIWFRGQGKRRYHLLPGLYRPDVMALQYDELALTLAFTNLGLSYAVQRPANEWEWYFLAQHHGLPTRLLDWTVNLLAAVYFAIEDFWQTLRKCDVGVDPPPGTPPVFGPDSPTVWVLDAGTVNQFSQREDVLYAPPREALDSYLPRFLKYPASPDRLDPQGPIALYPPRQNQRIVAQQGMFTLHGQDPAALDEHPTFPDGVIKLACIELDQARLNLIVDELIMAGITRLALFPELDSVARLVKWQYRD